MLKLSRVEINGFKSFVDPVALDVSSGITAIVGPNGCGKSNLADAITWVLGEQSAKSLRSSRMEDVIFSGSAGRKPLGMAEVSLTLHTEAAFPSAEDGRLVIGRRVYRGGQSQYRLNGKTVRLKEIKDLLMDTGLGIRNYAVIEQGKIGMILSGKPQERRKLLEEAAGITRYKQRKRIAELKLEEATANLMRLDDIIAEVERALRSLKRQANAARRFQAREAEYKELLDRVLRGRWYLLRSRLQDFERRLAALQDRDAELSATLHDDEATLAEGRERLDQLARALATRHQRQAELAGTIEGRQELIRGARQGLEDVAERRRHGSARAASLERQRAELTSSEGHLDARTRELIAARDEAARRVAEDEARIAAAQRRVEQAQSALESLRQRLLASLAEVNRLRAARQQQQVGIERLTLRRRFLGDESERLARQLAEAESTRAAVASAVAEAEKELKGLLDRRHDLAQALDALLRREVELVDERRRLESRLAARRERQRMLVELSEEHAGRRRALLAKLAASGLETPRFLTDPLTVPAGWEHSVDHYLGELADAVLLDAEADVLALGRALAGAGASGTFVRPLGAGGSAAEPLDDPAISGTLAAALGLPDELARALPPAYLVPAAEDALRLAAAHPGVAFLSRDRMWATGGVVRVQAEEAAPGVLAREHELAAIAGEIPELERRLAEVGGSITRLVGERTEQAGAIQQLDERVAELRREIAVAHARRQDVTARLDKLRAEQATVDGELEEIAAELAEIEARQKECAERLDEAESAHRELERELDRAQAAVEEAKEHRESLREAGADRRGELNLLEQRLEQHNQEASRMRRQRDEIAHQLAAWEEEQAGLERRRTELEQAIANAEKELQAALEQRARVQEDVLAEQDRLDRERERLRRLEARVSTTREQRDELRREIEALRVEQAGVRQDGEHLAISFRDQLGKLLPGCGLPRQMPRAPEEDAADAETGEAPAAAGGAGDAAEGTPNLSPPPADDGGVAAEDAAPEGVVAPAGEGETVELEEVEVEPIEAAELVQLEASLARAKGLLERLGPVNVLAAQEFEEQQERHGFLTAQRADVAGSVKRLKETIREINETSSSRFRQTFEAVNRTFGDTFTKLFRGGEAEMRLLDEDDLLDSGIEIVARPPGKRLQNIMLLSGGEKALTAIALLFALFQTKPSPFCILDEVDAPLDDVNVLRFVEILEEMARDTQFLIITHNKLTMERAGMLYGVTMEEKGVSKLVSVELDAVHPAASRAKTA